MATLTNEQIQKLTKEQQETVAAVELRLVQRRQGVLKAAREYPGYFIAPLTVGVICFLLLIFNRERHHSLVMCFFWLFALIQFHAASINRRQNALLELFETEIKDASEPKQSSADPKCGTPS